MCDFGQGDYSTKKKMEKIVPNCTQILKKNFISWIEVISHPVISKIVMSKKQDVT